MTTRVARLGSFAEVFNGKTPSRAEQRSSGHPVLKIRDVDEWGLFRGSFGSYVDPVFAEKHDTKQVALGDTLILNAGHSVDVVGSKIYKAQTYVAGALATGEWLVVRPDETVSDAHYVFRFMSSPFARKLIKNSVNGSHLYPRDVAMLDIPLPPLSAQRRIAAILDRADNLRTQRRRAIHKLEEWVTSAFISAFGDLDSKSEVFVSDLVDPRIGGIRTGPFGSDLLHSEFVDEGIAVLGIDNIVGNTFVWAKPRFITDEKYKQLQRYTVRPDDVVITIMGTVGRCAVIPADIGTAINTKHLCCISLDRELCEPEYLHHYFLKHPRARKYLASVSKGAIMDGLNMTIIRNMPVRLPGLPEQRAFVSNLETADHLRAQHLQQLAKLDELFASLQYRAFQGEL